MYLLLSFCVQLAGFYILYSTSARAVFERRKHNRWFYRHRRFSKVSGTLVLLASLIMFMQELGIGAGFFFALISVMTIGGFVIILIPLRKT